MSSLGKWACVLAAATTLAAVTACSDGIKQHIRERDFRSTNIGNPALAASPSPIANVADMPGWTTDVESAIAFARENGRRMVVFAQQGNSPGTTAMKNTLTSSKVDSALQGVEKVTFDAHTAPDLAARYHVQAPAVLVIDGTGDPIATFQGKITANQLISKL